MADSTQDTDQPAAVDGAVAVNSWERPWTVDEMRNAADDWSLAGDAGMLHYLQDFSQRIISRTHDIQGQVNGLVHESKLTGIRVQNAFNDFIMLANTQFVENRVYDEDVNTETVTNREKKETKEQTREEREAALIPKMTQAMQLGFSVIDTAFEKLDVNDVNSDSEDDEGSPYMAETILEPKDPYLSRALPYLIGSQAFMTDDDVGLTDVMSENEQSDQGSISDSDSESESDGQKPPSRKATVLDSYSETETDSSESERDPFRTKDDDSDVSPLSESETISQSGGPGDFASELAAKLGTTEANDKHRTRERVHSDVTKESKEARTDKKPKPHIDDDDMDLFGPPPMEDEDSPFGRKDGLFSPAGGLFDEDNDDEGGLFDDVIVKKPRSNPVAQSTPRVVKPASSSSEEEEEEKPSEPAPRQRTKSGRKVPVGGVSIFGGGDDDLFGHKKKQQQTSDTDSDGKEEPLMKPATEAAATKPPAASVSLGLFDDDDDDLFAAVAPKKTAPPRKDVVPAAASVDLFGDEDDEDLFTTAAPPVKKQSEKEKEEPKPHKKLPAGAVPMFGNQANPLAAAIRTQRPPSDKESSDENWEDDQASESSSRSGASSILRSGGLSAGLTKKTASPAVSSSSLFAEEPEDDLLTAKPKKEVLTTAKSVSKPKLAASKGLFGEDSEDEDLFATTPATKPKPTQVAPLESKPRSSSLFFGDEEEDDSLFSAAPKPVKKQVPGVKPKPVLLNSGLFEDDLFSSEVKDTSKVKEQPNLKDQPKVESKAKPEVVSKPNRPRNATLSLFDNDEDTNDLFGSQSLPPKPKPSATQPSTLDTKGTKPRARSLFADDDVLFGGDGEDPSVDLFGESSPLSPSEESKPFPPVPAAQKQEVTTEPMSEARLKDKVEVKGATISASSTDLFGGGGVIDEPDLFTGKPVEKMDPKVEVRGATTSESSTDKSAKAAGRWKPVGGVSMFGGMDPSMIKRRAGSNSSSPDSETKPLPPDLPGDDFFPETKPQTKPSASSIPPTSRPSGGKLIGKLQVNLNLNPSALLPGATPPVKEPAPVPVSFDTPAPASTLHTVQKDRVRVPNKRRPPSRKARLNPSSSGEDFMSSTEYTHSRSPSEGKLPNSIFPAATVSTAQPTMATMSHTSKTTPVAQKDLFGVNDVDSPNLFPTSRSFESSSKSAKPSSRSAEPTLSGAKAPLRVIDAKTDQEDLFPDDPSSSSHTSGASVPKAMSNIFSEAFAKSKSGYSRVKGPLDNNDEDDLFAGAAATNKPEKKVIVDISDDLFGARVQSAPDSSSKSKPSKAVVAAEVPDDDIFGAAAVKPVPRSAKPSTPAVVNSRPPAVHNDVDNIFSDSNLRAKKSSKPAVSEEDIFSSTQSKSKPFPIDDDIFSSAPAKASKPKLRTTINFDDDDDDLFGATSLPSSATKKQTTKAASKPNALLEDDIFADLPPSKSREKKGKKKPASTMGMFEDDDVDDIFAEKPKIKKSSTTKSRKPANASANIFGKDDTADIFDDPLNALMS